MGTTDLEQGLVIMLDPNNRSNSSTKQCIWVSLPGLRIKKKKKSNESEKIKVEEGEIVKNMVNGE